MCGRFTFSQSSQAIAQIFQVANVPELTPRYNIAPTQAVPTVLKTAEVPERQFQMLRWGLIPSWADEPSIGSRLINAKAETVADKPSFRYAFRKHRCLILADGFYEWQQQDGKKQPFYFRLNNGEPFAFAGLWERWENPQGETIKSCTILTTEANELVGSIHNRMPVILEPKDYDLWLDSSVQKPELLQPLLHPYSATQMDAYPVGTYVNKPSHDDPTCIQNIEEAIQD